MLHVGILTDHSISMRHLAIKARDDFNSIVESLKSSGVETTLTHMQFSDPYGTNIRVRSTDVNTLGKLYSYSTTGSDTPLYNSMIDLINEMKRIGNQQEDVYLIMVLTDGADNASNWISKNSIKGQIATLVGSDRWTFVVRGPAGYASGINQITGIPYENIQEWKLTEAGLEKSTKETVTAIRSYTASVATGSTSSSKFYANLDNVSESQIKAVMKDISSEVMIFSTAGQSGTQIRDFVNTRLAPFGKTYKKGAAFYQLTKTESEVQDYKIIIVRDKTSKAIYAGKAARDILGVPHTGNIKLAPGRHGNYEIFIQSTSVNRSLDKNTDLIYWENFDGSVPTPVVKIETKVVEAVLKNVKDKNHQPVSVSNDITNLIKQIVPNVAAKKAVATKVAAKTAKKRDRNTIQEQARRAINDLAPSRVPVKSLKNSLTLKDLGFAYQFEIYDLVDKLSKKFGFVVAMSPNVNTQIGDIVEFISILSKKT